jgi:hypothetical protein
VFLYADVRVVVSRRLGGLFGLGPSLETKNREIAVPGSPAGRAAPTRCRSTVSPTVRATTS